MKTYLEKVNKDFDSRKNYEEIVLKILNEYSRSTVKHPDNSEELRTLFKKDDDDKRRFTLFLDVDDTLINVSLFLLPGNEFR